MTNREHNDGPVGVPRMTIVIELESPPSVVMENGPTMDDRCRLIAWLESNPETQELVDWVVEWGDRGRTNQAPVRADVADPFAASGV